MKSILTGLQEEVAGDEPPDVGVPEVDEEQDEAEDEFPFGNFPREGYPLMSFTESEDTEDSWEEIVREDGGVEGEADATDVREGSEP